MIGGQIKKFRMAAGLTQQELARLTGYSQQRISKYEKSGNIDYKSLCHICDVLGLEITLTTKMAGGERMYDDNQNTQSVG